MKSVVKRIQYQMACEKFGPKSTQAQIALGRMVAQDAKDRIAKEARQKETL